MTTFDKSMQLLLRIAAGAARMGEPVSNATLADYVGLDQAQVSRMVKDLENADLIERNPGSRTVDVGPAFLGLGAAAASGEDLPRRSGFALRTLAATWREPAWLSVLTRNQVLTVRAEPSHGFSYFPVRAGVLTPAWCTGPGRALTLDLSQAELETLLAGEDFVGGGPGAVRDSAQMHSRNADSARDGVVVAEGEFEHDVVEFSAPVRAVTGGAIIAAISVALPSYRLEGRGQAIMDSVLKVSALLTAALANPSAPTTDRPSP